MLHALRAAALFATALALGPALAHLFALPNKVAMSQDAYFTAQAIYRGWNLLGLLLALQLAVLLALFLASRRDRLPAAIALLGLAGAQALFWTFTFPANQATANWTVMPPDWEMLRRHWEYSHAAGAGCQLLAMAALSLGLTRNENQAAA